MSSTHGAAPYTTIQTHGLIYCAVYARFSSDNQNPLTIADQIRSCRQLADQKGWIVLDEHIYTDEERTGKTIVGRRGFHSLMDAAKTKPASAFSYILVADVSRLGRNKADLFKTIDILSFQKVFVYFVEDGLDSKEPWFDETFHARAQQAARYSKSLGFKVKNARDGRFQSGYNPGGGCYGYKNVPDEDYSRKGNYGRPAVKGVLQVVDPEQAAIVVRIFTAYATGGSLVGIAKMLNAEGIPPSQNARQRDKPSWCKSAIKHILINSRYCGRVTWNVTLQELNPETGKYERRQAPSHEWLHKELPHLRIISDELWNEVQGEFARKAGRLGVNSVGGMTRTERSRKYLFSGLLRCGVCGGKMTITATQPPVYGCADHRNRNSCPNKLLLRVDILEETFIRRLTEQLQADEHNEEVVQSLYEYLTSTRNIAIENRLQAEKDSQELTETLRTQRIQRDNLVRAIREMGHSRALLADLNDVESRIGRVEELLEQSARVPAPEITLDEVRAFLKDGRRSFNELFAGEPEFLRHELQKRITTITLTPSVGPQGKMYTASGDVSLFSGSETAVQCNQGDLIALHCKMPLRFEVYTKPNKLLTKIAA